MKNIIGEVKREFARARAGTYGITRRRPSAFEKDAMALAEQERRLAESAEESRKAAEESVSVDETSPGMAEDYPESARDFQAGDQDRARAGRGDSPISPVKMGVRRSADHEPACLEWPQYHSGETGKIKQKPVVRMNMATVNALAKKLRAREFARILGKGRFHPRSEALDEEARRVSERCREKVRRTREMEKNAGCEGAKEE